MSRTSRPRRIVGGLDLAALVARVAATHDGHLLARLRRGFPELVARASLKAVAWRFRCRPAQLRRCLLGLPVSSKAARRILGR
jgi:hypothetical protein